jgi:hypothetical protein
MKKNISGMYFIAFFLSEKRIIVKYIKNGIKCRIDTTLSSGFGKRFLL